MDRYAIRIPLPDKHSRGVNAMMAEGYLPNSDYLALQAVGTGPILSYLYDLKERIEQAIKEVRGA